MMSDKGQFTRFLVVFLAASFLALQASAKAVFAHFMVGNTARYTVSDWKNDISLAQDAHIDAFALNIAHGEATNDKSIADAFAAAESLGFKLFFSFDYAGNGPWPLSEVTRLLKQYSSSSAHFRHNNKPFVSTFEGPANSDDWVTIKAETGCFFVPDWSSLGAKPALQLSGGVADGLFSWAAWPWGDRKMNTYVDASYLQYLAEAGKPYMMPVSPWFYTNMPGYNKNWAWRSDDLWYDRWIQVSYIQPEWVEIISWNDYGESHYIGPLNDKAYVAFGTGKAPYNYVIDMPHDAWRLQLPYAIDLYKSGKPSIKEESVVMWYRRQPTSRCSDGGTTGNTASQLQIELSPSSVFENRIFFTALLASNATITISIGGLEFEGSWDSEPDGGVGLYHGSFPFNVHLLGEVIVTVSRDEKIVSVKGPALTTVCSNGLLNFNAWVGGAKASSISAVSPDLSLSEQTCVAGSGVGNFAGICAFTCKYGYCPVGACYCTAMGKQKKLPKATGDKGYPANGDANYAGLCDFSCNYGYCPSQACSLEQKPAYIPTSSPFNPPACVKGSGMGNLAGLCSFSCAFSFCPSKSCSCVETGPLVAPPAPKDVKGVPDTDDPWQYERLKDLCDFTCSRGYCPAGACKIDSGDDGSDGDGSEFEQVIIDSGIWANEHPAVSCGSDCVLVLPPTTLPTPTRITFDGGYPTVLNVAWETPTVTTLSDGKVITTTAITHILQTTVVDVPPIVVTVLPIWPVTIPSNVSNTTIYPMMRIPPQTVVITDDPNPLSQSGVTHPVVTRSVTIPPYPWSSTRAKDNDIKPVIYTSAADKKSGPRCVDKAKCDKPCLSRIFCDGPCFTNCGGGGFAAANDPNPLPNPNPGPADPNNEDPDEDDCDGEIVTATDVWVSCKTIDSTSTSCTTTSSNVHTGCRATASATTTADATCYVVDPDEDQGQDGGAVTALVTTTDHDKITTVQPKPTTTTSTERPVQTHNVALGILTCYSENNGHMQGDRDHFATLDQINAAASAACRQTYQDFTRFKKYSSYAYRGTTRPDFHYEIEYSGEPNCLPPTVMDGRGEEREKGVQTCIERFSTVINNCDTAANGHDYWKAGGSFYRDCMTWRIIVEQPPV
ncbi:mutanase Pc12g07500 [Aspergillus lentulus]|uniref:glycoside hydrolase family 71 protein n=1 Tax=Aspergillus lentulus TaxID=293939 RepID=UPI00139533AF|nr:mutanase Pc12g07500 [Aspergillus lentulus]GFF43033.1 mutanase Pc12g07500 [Aspergillus lentulus]